MASTRAYLHDVGWQGRRAVIEHDPVTKRVEIRIAGPQGGVHGTIMVPEAEAATAFRAILEKIERA